MRRRNEALLTISHVRRELPLTEVSSTLTRTLGTAGARIVLWEQVKSHGDSWKQLYFERNLEGALER